MAPFLQKKQSRDEKIALVQEQLSRTEGLTPLEVYVDNPDKELPELRLLIKQWIEEGQLDGYLTTDRKAFVPKKAFVKAFEEGLEKGRIEVTKVSKKLRIPIKYVKETLSHHLASMGEKGHWDSNEKVFFTRVGARQTILELARGVHLQLITDIADELGWALEHVLKTLESLTEQHLFRGFLDASGVIHETTTLKVDLLGGGERAEKLLASFCGEKIAQIGYASLPEIMGVFGLDRQETIAVLENEAFRSRTGSTLRVSRNSDIVYEISSTLELAFRILLTHHSFPLNYLAERTDLPKMAWQDLLELIGQSISPLAISEGVVETQRFSKILVKGFNLEHLAQQFSIPRALVIRALMEIIGFNRYLFWGTDNQLRVFSDISFDCDLEKRRKQFPPEQAIVCLNCGHQVCSECFAAKQETAKCEQCGALRAFLLEFPRACPSCLVVFIDATHLIGHRFCPICSSEIPEPIQRRNDQQIPSIDLDELVERTRAGISMDVLSQTVNRSQSDALPFLEDQILNRFPSEYAIDVYMSTEQIENSALMIRLLKLIE
ncbi:MAG: hypothetical protein ACXACI_04010 [Candidatus Hodarchaeales archaeon]|jgi:hypothetical protein